MMYLRAPDRGAANDDLRSFIDESIPDEGMPARYGPRQN
jgi:hypothetical protein